MVSQSQVGRGGVRGGVPVVAKKGPWTTAEDAVLLEYVKNQGEGNWNAVQKNSRLQRCGKSCRLRWTNHLRPFLKKGPITPDEENTIIELHSEIGNKWARMATQLPGRTDNEIKNFWNTRLKRLQRAGLPVYPVELLRKLYNHNHQPPLNFSVSQSSTFASIISAAAAASSSTSHRNQHPRQKQKIFSFMKNCNPSDLLNHQPDSNNGLISGNAFLFRKELLFHQPLSGKSQSSDINLGLNSVPDHQVSTNTTSFDPVGLFGIGTDNYELSSIQNTTQNSNNSKCNDEEHNKTARGNSGLLEDLLQESQAIKRCNDNSDKNINPDDGLSTHTNQDLKAGNINVVPSNPKHVAGSGVSISGGINHEQVEVAEDMEDDLMMLLDCPSPGCIPNWYDIGCSTNTSKTDVDDELDDSICCWNNMHASVLA